MVNKNPQMYNFEIDVPASVLYSVKATSKEEALKMLRENPALYDTGFSQMGDYDGDEKDIISVRVEDDDGKPITENTPPSLGG